MRTAPQAKRSRDAQSPPGAAQRERDIAILMSPSPQAPSRAAGSFFGPTLDVEADPTQSPHRVKMGLSQIPLKVPSSSQNGPPAYATHVTSAVCCARPRPELMRRYGPP